VSYSQHEADLMTENRELRERLKGALEDLQAERTKNVRAQEHNARLDLKLQDLTNQLRGCRARTTR
jgi:chromosome condensin MukBEF ATPase and DNA-binding subunit MukB